MECVQHLLRAHEFPILSRLKLSQADRLEDERYNHILQLRCRALDPARSDRLVIEFVGVQQLRLVQPESSEIAVGPLSVTDIASWQWEGVRYKVEESEAGWLSLLCWDLKVTVE